VEAALNELPTDASIEDCIERLVYLSQIARARRNDPRGSGATNQDLRERFGL
jgi:hypothetical protein